MQFEMSGADGQETPVPVAPTQQTVETQPALQQADATQAAPPTQVPSTQTASVADSQFIEVPREDGTLHTRLEVAKIPSLWMEKERLYREKDAEARAKAQEADDLRKTLAYISQSQQAQAPRQPVNDYWSQRRAELVRDAQEFISDTDAAEKFAEFNLKNEQRVQEMMTRTTQSFNIETHHKRNEAEYERMRSEPGFDPEFNSENPAVLGIQMKFPEETVREHYQRFLRITGRGGPVPQTTAATSALHNLQNRQQNLYSAPSSQGAQPAFQNDSAFVQNQVEVAKKFNRKLTVEDLNEIRQMARATESVQQSQAVRQTGRSFVIDGQ